MNPLAWLTGRATLRDISTARLHRTPRRYRTSFADAVAYMRVAQLHALLDSMQMDTAFPDALWDDLQPLMVEINRAIILRGPDETEAMTMTVGEMLGWAIP